MHAEDGERRHVVDALARSRPKGVPEPLHVARGDGFTAPTVSGADPCRYFVGSLHHTLRRAECTWKAGGRCAAGEGLYDTLVSTARTHGLKFTTSSDSAPGGVGDKSVYAKFKGKSVPDFTKLSCRRGFIWAPFELSTKPRCRAVGKVLRKSCRLFKPVSDMITSYHTQPRHWPRSAPFGRERARARESVCVRVW